MGNQNSSIIQKNFKHVLNDAFKHNSRFNHKIKCLAFAAIIQFLNLPTVNINIGAVNKLLNYLENNNYIADKNLLVNLLNKLYNIGQAYKSGINCNAGDNINGTPTDLKYAKNYLKQNPHNIRYVDHKLQFKTNNGWQNTPPNKNLSNAIYATISGCDNRLSTNQALIITLISLEKYLNVHCSPGQIQKWISYSIHDNQPINPTIENLNNEDGRMKGTRDIIWPGKHGIGARCEKNRDCNSGLKCCEVNAPWVGKINKICSEESSYACGHSNKPRTKSL